MKFFYFILLICCAFTLSYSQSITFSKSYKIGLSSLGSHVSQTNDGGYIVTGSYSSPNCSGPGCGYLYLLKTDKYGDTVWTKKYFGEIPGKKAFGNYVAQLADSGFILIGYGWGMEGALGESIFILKTNVYGDSLWTKTYNSPASPFINPYPANGLSACLASDGGFMIIGWAKTDSTSNRFYLIKTDSLGNKEWDKLCGGVSDWSIGCKVIETKNRDYIAVGTLAEADTGHIYITSVDSAGNELWSKILYDTESNNILNPIPFSIYALNDSTFIISANSYIIVIDTNGNILWRSDVFNPVSLIPVTETAFTFFDENHSVSTIDTNEIVLMNTSLGTENIPWDIQRTNDMGYILTGYNTDYNIILIKLDSVLNLLTNVALNPGNQNLRIFPNPTDGAINIDFILSQGQKGQFFLYNVLGDIIEVQNISYLITKQYNCNLLPDGIYFYEIQLDDRIVAKDKLIILKK